jgi:hypothetical protein
VLTVVASYTVAATCPEPALARTRQADKSAAADAVTVPAGADTVPVDEAPDAAAETATEPGEATSAGVGALVATAASARPAGASVEPTVAAVAPFATAVADASGADADRPVRTVAPYAVAGTSIGTQIVKSSAPPPVPTSIPWLATVELKESVKVPYSVLLMYALIVEPLRLTRTLSPAVTPRGVSTRVVGTPATYLVRRRVIVLLPHSQ